MFCICFGTYKIEVLETVFCFSLIFISVTGQQIILKFCLHRLTYECHDLCKNSVFLQYLQNGWNFIKVLYMLWYI